MSRLICIATLLLISSTSSAAGIQIGAPLPALEITDRGEVLLANDEITYAPWRLGDAGGKVHIVQYMAATLSAKKMGKKFTDALEAAIPYEGFHITTVLNLDDAMWGTTGLVTSEAKASKQRYPQSSIVLDAEGSGLKAWQLERKSCSIIITDAQGHVTYVKNGAWSTEEIENALHLIRRHIAATGHTSL